MNKFLLATLASVTVIAPPAYSKGVPLEEATVTRIVNDVRILDPKKGIGPARVSQVVKDDMGVKTGVKSRAELLFQDSTITRLGAESYFTFRPGTREMSLDSGTMLLQVPKDHGGATIRSASVTASVTGTTILFETIPNKTVKALVLEGSLRLSLTNRPSEKMTLRAGNMIIFEVGAKRLPEPVTVDLRRLIRTSSLVNPELFSAKNRPKPLPSMPLIAAAIDEQDRQRAKGNLQDTNLVILGKGTKIIAASQETMNLLSGGTASTNTNSNSAVGVDPTSTTSATTSGTSSSGTLSGGVSGSGSVSVGTVQNTQSATTAATASAKANAAATPPVSLDGATVSIGTSSQPYAGDVDVDTNQFISSGKIQPGSPAQGAGGNFNVFTTGRARVTKWVEVSSDYNNIRSASGGSIHIESLKTGSGTGIEITNSGELLAYLNTAAPGPGGRVELVTAGSDILINGNLRADRGTISISNNGTGGRIIIDNANLVASVINISALQANGALEIGRNRISADSLMKLYGGSGTGGVRFTSNTTLDGNSLKYIAGHEVRIDSGRVVTIGGGPASVFTNVPNYSSGSGGNGSTSGRFEQQTAPGSPYAPPLLPYLNRP